MVWIPLAVSGLLNAATWVLLLVSIKPQSQLIVLHTNVYFGVDRVGHWSKALLIPVFGLLVMAVNLILSKFSHERELIFGYFFLVCIPVLQLLLLLAAVFLVIANLPVAI